MLMCVFCLMAQRCPMFGVAGDQESVARCWVNKGKSGVAKASRNADSETSQD